MDIDALFRAKDFAVKTRDAMLDKLQDRNNFPILFFHVNDVSRTYRITNAAASAFIQVDIDYHAILRLTNPRRSPKVRESSSKSYVCPAIDEHISRQRPGSAVYFSLEYNQVDILFISS